MDIGISYWFGYPSPPKERISLIKNSGFKNVALYWTDEYKSVTGSKKDVYYELNKAGIQISSFHASFNFSHLLWDVSIIGELFRRQIAETIYDAYKYNVPIVVIHTNGSKYHKENISMLLDPLFNSAEKYDIKLCVENLQIKDNLNSIITEYNCSLCYDVGHNNIRNSSFKLINNENIKYIHIHDNNGQADQHLLPFQGSINWNKTIKEIRTIPKAKKILEVHNNIGTYDEAEIYLQKAMDCAKLLDV